MDNVYTYYILALPAVFFSFFSFVFASGSQSIKILKIPYVEEQLNAHVLVPAACA